MVSWVWSHYTKLRDRKKIRCDHCQKEYSDGTSTRSQADHLKKQHDITPESKRPKKAPISEPPVVTISENDEASTSQETPRSADIMEGEPEAKKAKFSDENSKVVELVNRKSVQPSTKTSLNPSIEYRFAKLAAVDGFSCNAIAKSEFIQEGIAFLLSIKRDHTKNRL